MKRSFTTLGCPDWTLDEILRHAPAMGFDGVDFRFLEGTTNLWERPALSTQLSQSARLLADAGLEVPCLSSGVRVCQPTDEKARAAEEELQRMLEIAAGLSAPLLRLFPGNPEQAPLDAGLLGHMSTRLHRYIALAEGSGVTLVVETHDGCSSGAAIRALLDAAGRPAGAAALWDIHHPLRHCGENPAHTAELLKNDLRYVHWKDARLEPDGADALPNKDKLCLPGEGDMPMPDFIRALRSIGYDDYIAFEWEKPWAPYLPEADIAFPRFVESLRALLKD